MKIWKIAAISAFVVLAIGAVGAGYAFAQAPTNPWGGGFGPGYGGMMGRGGGFAQDGGDYSWMNGMHQWMANSGGMHTLVWDGLADALDLTTDELNAELTSGKTLAEIAEAQGVSEDELAAALETSVKAGLEKAVADGVLTQEEADWMLSQMGGNYAWMIGHMGSAGFGPGGCHGGFNGPASGANS